MSYVIRILALADGRPSLVGGHYLASYDANGRDGMGAIDVTTDIEAAMPFGTAIDAYKVWGTQADPPHELRDDGKPNRPLTAFTIEVVRK